MKIDLSGFNAPEGFPVEALQNQELQNYINEVGKKQNEASLTVMRENLEKANRNKVIADEKVDGLQAKLLEAQKNPGTTDEQVKKLEQKLKSAQDDAALEFGAKIKALEAQIGERDEKIGSLSGELDKTNLSGFIRDGIAEYNSSHSGVPVVQGADKYLIEAGLNAYKRLDDGSYRAYDGDTALTGVDGFMNRVEFISSLRDNPDYKLFFKQPSGGGAAGGKGGGAGEKIQLSGDKKNRTQALANKFPELKG